LQVTEGGGEIAEGLGSWIPEVVTDLVLGKMDVYLSGCRSGDFLKDLF